MSKYLDDKKNSILRVSRLVDDLSSMKEAKEVIQAYKTKYDNLQKKYSNLERVFNFHKGIIQNISSGIITTDYQGIITFINKSALALLGYNVDQVRGKILSTVFADTNEGNHFINQVVKEKRMYDSREANLLSHQGVVIPIGFSTTPLKSSENGDGAIFIFRDIRELINFRKQMERMDRLATLGELSAGIAHEIRNPLAGIKTSAEVLEESFSPGDFRSQLISRIIKEIDRSNKLLQRFFNFAKPSRPKPGFHYLQNIIDGVYLLMRARFNKHHISFKTFYESDLPEIYIDESQFEQVIINLILNAFDAMPDGGALKITASFNADEKVFEEQNSSGCILITIRDDGTGISPEKIEKIFNPFYTTKSDGVGLGLSICSRLLEENHSRIEVESSPENGALFKVFLPYVNNKKQEF